MPTRSSAERPELSSTHPWSDANDWQVTRRSRSDTGLRDQSSVRPRVPTERSYRLAESMVASAASSKLTGEAGDDQEQADQQR